MSRTIDEQIKAVAREIRFRHNAYPKWVSGGRMSQKDADYQISCMESVMVTLKEVQQKERLI